jgi:hypothetical protein
MKLVNAALALLIFSLAPLSNAGALPPNTPCGLKRCDGYCAQHNLSRKECCIWKCGKHRSGASGTFCYSKKCAWLPG